LLRIAAHDEKGVNAANAGFLGIIKLGICHSPAMKFTQPFLGIKAQSFNLAELNRFCWTGLGTRRLQTGFLAVIAECTFKSSTILFVLLHYAKRTSHYAVGTAITHIRLHVNAAKFCAYDCACWTCFKTARHFTVLADV
jgi:hypothetical protein